MKKLAAVTAAAATIALAGLVGCNSNNKKPVAANASVTDIKAAPAPAPAYQPAPVAVQPVIADTPTPAYAAATPAPTAAAPAAAPTITGSTYVVQKGDTLFKIARAKYGDATAVKKIKDANPGLDANHIKVGQKINLP